MDTKNNKRARTEDNYPTNAEFYILLAQTKAEDFALEKPEKQNLPIYVANRNDLVTDIWKGLIARNFLSVPVVTATNEYHGIIDMFDIVKYIVSSFSEKDLSDKDFWALVEEEKIFAKKTVLDLMAHPLQKRNPFHPVKQGYSAFAVFEPMARESNLHRIAVVDNKQNLDNFVTQSQVITFLRKNLSILGKKGGKPLRECHGMLQPVVSVKETDTAMFAFQQMVKEEVSGVAVVNANGSLKGNLSLRDLKLIGSDARLFWRLQQSVKDFIVKLKQEYEIKHSRPWTVIHANPTDSLGDAITMLADHHIHRVFIVDNAKDKAPIGVCSLKDVLYEILN